jgi:membrane protease YdiL (CAAX protease family)
MEEHKDFPNFWGASLILALLVGLQIIFSMLAYDLGVRYEWGDPRAGVITVLSCGIAFSLLMSYKKIGYKELFNATSNSVKNLILVLLIPIVLTVGGGVFWIADITNLMMLYFPVAEEEHLALSRMLSGGFVSIVSVCVIAPIIEEMLFRGIVLRSFLVSYSATSAILLSSLLFALFHLTVTQLPVAFIMGCLLGWLYFRTRSLWPSILAHFLYNSFTMFLWSTYYSSETQVKFSPEFNSIGVTIGALVFSTVGIVLLYYILRPESGRASKHA